MDNDYSCNNDIMADINAIDGKREGGMKMDRRDLAQIVRELTKEVGRELSIDNGPDYTVLPISEASKLFYEILVNRLTEHNGKKPTLVQKAAAKFSAYAFFNNSRIKNANGFYTRELPDYFFINPEKFNGENSRLVVAHELTHARIDYLRRKDSEYEAKRDYFEALAGNDQFNLEEPFCHIMEGHLTGEGDTIRNLRTLYDQQMARNGTVTGVKFDDPFTSNLFLVYRMFREDENFERVVDLIVNPFDSKFLETHSKQDTIKAIKEGECLRYNLE